MQITHLKKISTLVVDDHELVREGIARLLNDTQDIKIVGQLSSGERALEYLASAASTAANSDACSTSVSYLMPDIILLSTDMQALGGIETIQGILKLSPNCKVVAMSSAPSENISSQMLNSGACAFIAKSVSVEELLEALRTVARKGNYALPRALTRLASDHCSNESIGLFDKLSRRELQISKMLTDGQKVSQIATHLNLSPKTLYSYRSRIFEKLEISSDVELTLLAFKQ